jgi:tRNA threonylcarbamoyladenosine biosynthesis protein TsaB
MKPPLVTLAFDCACSGLSVAVLAGEKVLAQHCQSTATGQAALLAPVIQAQLLAAGMTPKDLGLIGVTNGPGSFTGIRIGLAMARGLALALDVPLAACSTFDAVLRNLPSERSDRRTILAIDSRREEIFLRDLAADRTWIARPDDAVATLPNGTYTLAGDAAPMMHQAFEAAGRAGEIAAQDDRPPVAAHFAVMLAAFGADQWRKRNRDDGMPRPLYLREADVTMPKPAAKPAVAR